MPFSLDKGIRAGHIASRIPKTKMNDFSPAYEQFRNTVDRVIYRIGDILYYKPTVDHEKWQPFGIMTTNGHIAAICRHKETNEIRTFKFEVAHFECSDEVWDTTVTKLEKQRVKKYLDEVVQIQHAERRINVLENELDMLKAKRDGLTKLMEEEVKQDIEEKMEEVVEEEEAEKTFTCEFCFGNTPLKAQTECFGCEGQFCSDCVDDSNYCPNCRFRTSDNDDE